MEFLRLNKEILAGNSSSPLKIPEKKEATISTTAPPARLSMADPSHGYNPRASFDEYAKRGLRQEPGNLATLTSAPMYQTSFIFGQPTNNHPVARTTATGFSPSTGTSLFSSAYLAPIPSSIAGNMASSHLVSNTYQSDEQLASVLLPEAKRQEHEQQQRQQQQQLVSYPANTAPTFLRSRISDSMIDPSLFTESSHQPQQSGQHVQPQQQPPLQRSAFHVPADSHGPANLNPGANFDFSNLAHNHHFLPNNLNINISGTPGINHEVARQAIENAQSVEYQLLNLKVS